MKRIITLLLSSLGLFTLTYSVNAQPYERSEKGVSFSKSISDPDTDGKYTITLEAFIEGSATITSDNKPTDFVLVLDYSESMVVDNNVWHYSIYDLKQAIAGFIDTIKNAVVTTDKFGGNRIAIVLFANNVFKGTVTWNIAQSGWAESWENANDPHTISYSSNLNTLFPASSFITGSIAHDKTYKGSDHTDYSVSVNGDNLLGYKVEKGTYTTGGLNEARTILSGQDYSGTDRNRVVILFTDGTPQTFGNQYSDSRNNSISAARNIKQTGATLYTVGLFYKNTDYNPTNPQATEATTFLSYMSSDYPNATQMPNGYVMVSGEYSMVVRDAADLNEIFAGIAKENLEKSADLNTETVATVDVVSTSFTLPENASEEDISVYLVPCTGVDSNDYRIFSNDEAEFDKDPDGITTTLSESGQVPGKKDKITVNGFDFNSNWCGYITDETKNPHTQTKHGNKLVIEIPVFMDPSAVGGPGVATNVEGSGIYDGDTAYAIFTSPTINLPVNIHINKQGLDVGESSKFIIERKTESMNDWEEVTSVFVTQKEGQKQNSTEEPLTKIMGLPSTDANGEGFVYRITEEKWGWSYTLDSVTGIGEVTDENPTGVVTIDIKNGEEVTTDKFITNPITFKNSKIKDDIETSVRHAESKVINTFSKAGDIKNKNGGMTHVDSKK